MYTHIRKFKIGNHYLYAIRTLSNVFWYHYQKKSFIIIYIEGMQKLYYRTLYEAVRNLCTLEYNVHELERDYEILLIQINIRPTYK